MRAIDIKWDTDGDEEVLKTLPTEMDIPNGIDEEGVADWLMRPVFVSLVLFWKQKRIGFVLETEKKDKTKTLKKSRTGLTC